MKIITEYNGKGGVGKTFTAATLAYLAASDAPTLVGDLDHQGQIAMSYGLDPENSVYDWLVKGKRLDKVVTPTMHARLLALRGAANTELVDRSFLNSAEIEIEATGSERNKFVVAVEMIQERMNDFFDLSIAGDPIEYVIFDCPPRRSLLVEAAIGMSDLVVIPTSMAPREIEGTEQGIAAVRKINPKAKIIVAPNRVAIRSDVENYDTTAFCEFWTTWRDEVLIAEPIPPSTAVRKVESSYAPVWLWKGRSDTLERVKTGYQKLWDQIKNVLE